MLFLIFRSKIECSSQTQRYLTDSNFKENYFQINKYMEWKWKIILIAALRALYKKNMIVGHTDK